MTEDTQAESRTDDAAEEQTAPEPAAQDYAPDAGGEADDGPQVNLDVAEQQVAEWRREDEALLGEAPELTPSSRGLEEVVPTNAAEADIASMREEAQAALGEPIEASSLPTANEA